MKNSKYKVLKILYSSVNRVKLDYGSNIKDNNILDKLNTA